MTILAATSSTERSCSLCQQGLHTTHSESDRMAWTTTCKRHKMPIVTLKRHSGSPTAGEWWLLEKTAKRSFPEYRWQRPNTLNSHFYLHAVDRRGPCNIDHAAVA